MRSAVRNALSKALRSASVMRLNLTRRLGSFLPRRIYSASHIPPRQRGCDACVELHREEFDACWGECQQIAPKHHQHSLLTRGNSRDFLKKHLESPRATFRGDCQKQLPSNPILEDMTRSTSRMRTHIGNFTVTSQLFSGVRKCRRADIRLMISVTKKSSSSSSSSSSSLRDAYKKTNAKILGRLNVFQLSENVPRPIFSLFGSSFSSMFDRK